MIRQRRIFIIRIQINIILLLKNLSDFKREDFYVILNCFLLICYSLYKPVYATYFGHLTLCFQLNHYFTDFN